MATPKRDVVTVRGKDLKPVTPIKGVDTNLTDCAHEETKDRKLRGGVTMQVCVSCGEEIQFL
jgi:hypothetical protein